MASGSKETSFHYGPGRQRVLKREFDNGAVVSRTYYFGSVEVVREGLLPGEPTYRRSIGSQALVTIESNGITRTRYQHLDHLGSIVAMSNSNGLVDVKMSFDAWGNRRLAENLGPRWLQWTNNRPGWVDDFVAITPRGYTGHEHVDDHGIIHMNGRIYDPHLARFLQADPFIEDTGTLNRYTYVHNNPLAYTDPSGYFSVRKFAPHRIGKRATRSVMRALGPTVSGVVVTWASGFCGPAYAACFAAGNYEMTRAYGGTRSEGLRNAAIAGVTAAAMRGASRIGGVGGTVVMAGIGGVASHFQGGSFGHAFAAAGISSAMSPVVSSAGFEGGIVISALVGGSISELTGGKFANGAVTAAMSYAFGSLASRGGSGDGSGSYDPTDAEMAAYLEDSGFWDSENMLAHCRACQTHDLMNDLHRQGAISPEEFRDWQFDYSLSTATAALANLGGGAFLIRWGAARGLGANPFLGKSGSAIARMLQNRGFIGRGPNPAAGRGTYVNPRTGRGYHIDAKHPAPKGPHVGVHRPRGLRDRLPTRDYPSG